MIEHIQVGAYWWWKQETVQQGTQLWGWSYLEGWCVQLLSFEKEIRAASSSGGKITIFEWTAYEVAAPGQLQRPGRLEGDPYRKIVSGHYAVSPSSVLGILPLKSAVGGWRVAV